MLQLLTDTESADISFKIEGTVCNYNFGDDDDINNFLNTSVLFGSAREETDFSPIEPHVTFMLISSY